MLLETLGWNGFFASQAGTGVPGRVAAAHRERFVVWTENGDVEAAPSGALRHQSPLWPTVGDWVELRGSAIDRVLERRTVLTRKQPGKAIEEQVLAANLDVLFLVTGLDHDYNPRRLERYLVLAKQSGARPVVLLNKSDRSADLGIDAQAAIRGTRTVCPGCEVFAVSGLTGDGLDRLPALFAMGESAAMLGSSGAGKSTILNRLLGEYRQATTAVRHGDDRGRHTTTSRQMFAMPGGWLLMDLPGLREVQLWASADEVESSFADVDQLSADCRFRNCSHTGEPGCAVAALDADRLAGFQKLQREAAYLERKTDGALLRANRDRWKAIERSMRHHPRRGW